MGTARLDSLSRTATRPDHGLAGGLTGFTLVEVMVVLVVLGITAAVATPALQRLTAGGAPGAARQLTSAWSRARDEAIRRGQPVTVALEVATGAYVTYLGSPDHPSAPLVQDTIHLAGGAHIRSGTQAWVRNGFGPLGQSLGPAVTITDGRHKVVVAADPWTGDISTHGD